MDKQNNRLKAWALQDNAKLVASQSLGLTHRLNRKENKTCVARYGINKSAIFLIDMTLKLDLIAQ